MVHLKDDVFVKFTLFYPTSVDMIKAMEIMHEKVPYDNNYKNKTAFMNWCVGKVSKKILEDNGGCDGRQ